MRSGERNETSVLGRAFRLLEAFEPQGRDLGLGELARRTNLPKSTVHRLAAQLMDLGALERSGESYRLGIRLFEIGSSVFRQRRLREAALPFMEDLYEATHETVHLGVLDGLQILYVEKISGRRSSHVASQIGTRKPLHCTALGKAILSASPPDLLAAVVAEPLTRFTTYTIRDANSLNQQLVEARKEGVAYDREEFALGITCVAAPLAGRIGQAEAAISVTGPTSRFAPERMAVAVRTAALSLSRVLNGGGKDPWR